LSELLPDGALLAVDLGTVRTGVAACDPQRILAYPVGVIPSGEPLEDHLNRLVAEHGAVAVVVGYPLALDGRPGIAADKVRAEAARLAGRIQVPVWLADERLSTAAAYARLRETGRTTRRARGLVDAQAAVGILESVLDASRRSLAIATRVEMEEMDE